jgi:hypothetical protein
MNAFGRRCGLLVGICLTAAAIGGGATRATDLERDTALGLAPVDADLFATTLQLGQQWQQLVSSPVLSDLLAMPYFKAVLGELQEDWQSGRNWAADVRWIFEQPAVRPLLDLLQESIRDEVFFLAGGNFSDFALELNRLSQQVQGMLIDEDIEALLDWYRDLPAEQFSRIPVPTLVAGFKIDDRDNALLVLDQLQGFLSLGIAQLPQLAELGRGVRRVDDQRGSRIAWTIRGRALPWDLIGVDQLNIEMLELLDKARSLLDERQMTVTIGLLDSYLILAISEQAATIAKLGQEAGGLLTLPELAPVWEAPADALVSVAYVSDRYKQTEFAISYDRAFSRQRPQIEAVLEEMYWDEQWPDYWRPLAEDLQWLDDEIADLVPTFKGSLQFAWMTEFGYRGQHLERTANVLFDGTQPLPILEQIGGRPLVLLAQRRADRPDYFQLARRVFRKLKGYLDGMAHEPALLGDENADQLRVVLEYGWPLLTRWADAWETLFLPAVADGQHAFVWSATGLSPQQLGQMVPGAEPGELPLPELALVLGVSDADRLVAYFEELFDIFDAAADVLRTLDPDAVPDGYRVPRPVAEPIEGGTAYRYRILNDALGLPDELLLEAQLFGDFFAVGYSPRQLQAIRQPMPAEWPAAESGRDRLLTEPLSGVGRIDFGGLFEIAKPWGDRLLQILTDPTAPEMLVASDGRFPPLMLSDAQQMLAAMTKLGVLTATSQVESSGQTVTHWRYDR